MTYRGKPKGFLRELGEKYGYSAARMRRIFKQWCAMNGFDPEDFRIIGGPRAGEFAPPKAFYDWFEQFYGREKRVVITSRGVFLEIISTGELKPYNMHSPTVNPENSSM